LCRAVELRIRDLLLIPPPTVSEFISEFISSVHLNLADPDRAGNFLKLDVADIDDTELLIHAMPLRPETA